VDKDAIDDPVGPFTDTIVGPFSKIKAAIYPLLSRLIGQTFAENVAEVSTQLNQDQGIRFRLPDITILINDPI
jgi:hypothetical protein